jgi:CRP-like cAMP-binding protein
MKTGALGKLFKDRETIVRQGEVGDCMYVIQDGQVEVLVEDGEREVRVATRGANDFFGEMAIFERAVRSATIRALGEARVLTVDKRNLLRAINEDPSMAFQLIQAMSHRIRELTSDLVQLRLDDRRQHQRITAPLNVSLETERQKDVPARLINISKSGGLVASSNLFDRDQLIWISILGGAEKIQATVSRISEAGLFGLQFLEPVQQWPSLVLSAAAVNSVPPTKP